MLFTVIIILHVIVCILLVLMVLVQSDKGGGLAGALGGMGGGVNTVFGGRGTANVLSKTTTWLAVIFLTVCLGLNLMVAHRSSDQVKTILQKRAEKIQKSAPAAALPEGAIDPTKALPQAPEQAPVVPPAPPAE